MISTLLVANRGEIARRIFRTCRVLGIATVAVYSDADAGSPHVREADIAVRLPGSASADTYLRGDLIVQAARKAGADAVHPGYGFLSESAHFAQMVLDAGLVWVGPSPEAIADMGSKTRAKELMAAAGVPVLGAIRPDGATFGGLPLLVKAAAGGGGRGMRIVRDLAELGGAVTAARAEAAASFGSDEVFCEPYVERGRHVEVQILADTAGTVWTLGERDCSLQRRHQKVIEETPAPCLSDETRRALADAAASARAAVMALPRSARSCTIRIPRPPPPAAALTSSGRSPCVAVSGRIAPRTGTPAAAISSLARVFEPISTMASGGGPTHTSPASSTICAKWAFSDRKP